VGSEVLDVVAQKCRDQDAALTLLMRLLCNQSDGQVFPVRRNPFPDQPEIIPCW